MSETTVIYHDELDIETYDKTNNFTVFNQTISIEAYYKGDDGYIYIKKQSDDTIVESWRVSEDGTINTTYTIPEGKYYFQTNANNVLSGSYAQLTYEKDVTEPSISFSPTSKDDNEPFDVTVTASDSESTIENTWYSWETEVTTPSSWTSFTNGTGITLDQEGENYLYAKAEDFSGNTKIDYSGKYILTKDLFVMVNGTWLDAKGIYVKESGVWDEKELYLKVNDTWTKKV